MDVNDDFPGVGGAVLEAKVGENLGGGPSCDTRQENCSKNKVGRGEEKPTVKIEEKKKTGP